MSVETTPASGRIERRSAEVAKSVIEWVLPEPELRQSILGLLAESVRHAHATKDTSWGLTLHPDGVRLNVGPIEAFYFGRRKDGLLFYMVADDERLSDPEREQLRALSVEFTGGYKSVPFSNRVGIPPESVSSTLPRLRDSHLSLVEKAARTVRTRMPWHESHSPGVTDYLRSLGYEIKEPGYTKPEEKGQSTSEEFAELYAEFSASYLVSNKGRKHLSVYEGQRAEAQRNYEDIVVREERGEDVTDLVLAKLLPHADTAGNRQRGSWIHTAPAVTKDIKSWFEGAGLKKAGDWPAVAAAVLAFIKRVTGDPSQLASACTDFSALPISKGFQTGLLSPILNALRPDQFLIVNSKTRKTFNYFSGSSYSHSLTDYPTLNEVGRTLVTDLLGEVNGKAGSVEARDSDLFDMFSHWLVAEKKFDFSNKKKVGVPRAPHYWKIAPGEDAWQWEECRDQGFIAIGWDELGDLSELSREEFEARRDELLTEHNDWTKEGVEQAWKFAQIRRGDLVVANHGTTKILGIGTVTGTYYFVPEIRHGHRIPIRWADLTQRRVKEEGWRRTLVELDSEKFGAIVGFSAPDDEPLGGTKTFDVHPPYSFEACATETGVDEETLARWLRAIERKGQAVYYGPPGTGKTFIAERVARHLVAGGDGILSLVQFHPAYAYEDFIQGIRPISRAGGGLDYPLVPGRFLDLCEQAASRSGTSVLIVDEINRANLSRVFGELMYLLEYRDREVPLAGGGALRIPRNVRLIGTMNTADRSIALVDHALRRRFAFIALDPNFDVLRAYHADTGFAVGGLVETLRMLNQEIGDPHYAVGTSYFLRPDLDSQIEDIWRMEIEPYVDEYFFDNPGKAAAFRWDKVWQRITG